MERRAEVAKASPGRACDSANEPIHELLSGWRSEIESNCAPDERAPARALLESDGGTYDERLLGLRATLFEALESAIEGVDRDLELLNRSLVRALFPKEPTPSPSPGPTPTSTSTSLGPRRALALEHTRG